MKLEYIKQLPTHQLIDEVLPTNSHLFKDPEGVWEWFLDGRELIEDETMFIQGIGESFSDFILRIATTLIESNQEEHGLPSQPDFNAFIQELGEGMVTWEDHEAICHHEPIRNAAIRWCIRCLANPDLEGSEEILKGIMARRELIRNVNKVEL